MSGHLYLIDGAGFIYRAYYALPKLTRKIDGLPTGALSGFCNMLWNLQRRLSGEFEPSHMAVIFDAGKKTFRNEIDPTYKANRPPTPRDLAQQFPLIREATRQFNLPVAEQHGYEADDLIATYARVARRAGMRVTIVSSDKDLMQLCGEEIGVTMYDPMKSRRLSDADIVEKFGVAPSQVRFVQALAGDSIDNVPGAKGVGVKTAGQLIRLFGDVDGLLANIDKIEPRSLRQKIEIAVDKIRLSLELVTLEDRADLPLPLDQFAVEAPIAATLIPYLKAMELAALATRVAEYFHLPFDELPPASIAIGEEWAWYREAMAGRAPVTTTEPQCGFFQRRIVKGGPYVPARIWIDWETRMRRCEVDGEIADPVEQWTYLASRPIAEVDWRYKTAHAAWARQHAPDSADANPGQPIDLIKSALPF